MSRLTNPFILLFCTCFMVTGYSQNDTKTAEYRRSSLYTLMVADSTRNFSQLIQETFVDSKIPEKFNNHVTNERSIPKLYNDSLSKAELKEAQKVAITEYLSTHDIAKSMVAKWFNRSEQGGFNMDLISERGFYNASDLDVKIAKNSERGTAMLADAGEELIKNTFVIVNNFKYTDKEEVAEKAKGLLASIGSVAVLAGASEVAEVTEVASEGVGILGKGYVIKTDALLFRLKWNDEVASIFYNDYWTEDEQIDEERVNAFNESNVFELEYIGTQMAWADLQSTTYTKKTDEELITIATMKASDAVTAKLQREYEVFRTKTPLMSSDPLSAKIGLKEGLEKGDKYEVLEQVLNKEGKTEYKRVGVIKVDKNQIWDNRFNADEENTDDTLEYTVFSGKKKKFYAGMLIRQIN
ncbi:hypothetical protein [Psychroserpens ponticola]|uniref:Uncharacterized protein n=1 Tax=Psychroserpens ponticola TaxID=2932268 RepID=A0ABY7RU29_9FLAO|nr:hypothetical protein [Psychroserpens ponticola]WCO00612.1 hypothetical protein MUN68_011100 [Psychroserpens ponticola]